VNVIIPSYATALAHAALWQVGAYDARDVHLVFLLGGIQNGTPYEPMAVSLIA